jgi:NADH-quinone oxidoreductase subunit A
VPIVLDSQVGYIPILVAFVMFSVSMAGVLTLSYFLGPKRSSLWKRAPFESGEAPISSPRQRFSIAFYLVGIFFIVFDIEAVFLYPWAVLFRTWLRDPALGSIAFAEMFIFLGVLTLGLVYVWKRGGLEWE